MSWQTYVDSNLVGSGAVRKAAIVGQDGNTWATSQGFTISKEEATTLIKAYKDPSAIRANGLRIAGTRYITLKADDRSIYGKQGSNGVVTVKTKQAVLIGVYDQNQQPGNAANVVEKLADYLIGVNY